MSKPRGVWCSHCTKKACAIYEERPDDCRQFNCLWLKVETLPDELRPDKCGFVMTALKAHGVGFAIDDFGTGYSSLSYLNRLPIDKLKIDRSFVAGLDGDGPSRAIVSVILSMARAMKLKVVAEGVETRNSCQMLKDWGCVAYQGFLFDRPLPAAGLTHAERRADRNKDLDIAVTSGADVT